MSASSGSQTKNGKSFEYAIAKSFEEITGAVLIENEAYTRAKACFEAQTAKRQTLLERAGAEMSMFLQAHDSNTLTSAHISLQEDSIGISGDVRDVIISVQSGEIGISAKVNHAAVKHSRLSAKLDFGQKWTGCPCSKQWTCSTTRLVVSQVSRIWRVFCKNPPNPPFFSGSCSITSVIEQL
jgi:hypothetical protein